LTAPFEVLDSRAATGIPNGTETKSSVNVRFDYETEQLRPAVASIQISGAMANGYSSGRAQAYCLAQLRESPRFGSDFSWPIFVLLSHLVVFSCSGPRCAALSYARRKAQPPPNVLSPPVMKQLHDDRGCTVYCSESMCSRRISATWLRHDMAHALAAACPPLRISDVLRLADLLTVHAAPDTLTLDRMCRSDLDRVNLRNVIEALHALHDIGYQTAPAQSELRHK
jgi:hypothetical protein